MHDYYRKEYFQMWLYEQARILVDEEQIIETSQLCFPEEVPIFLQQRATLFYVQQMVYQNTRHDWTIILYFDADTQIPIYSVIKQDGVVYEENDYNETKGA